MNYIILTSVLDETLFINADKIEHFYSEIYPRGILTELFLTGREEMLTVKETPERIIDLLGRL